jgi:glutathione S-transferase
LLIDAAGLEGSRARVDEVFADVGRRLDDGRPYLTGDRFTAADLTFAAFASILVFPEQLTRYLPMEFLPPASRALADAYRATRAGAFALRMYEQERGVPGAAALA